MAYVPGLDEPGLLLGDDQFEGFKKVFVFGENEDTDSGNEEVIGYEGQEFSIPQGTVELIAVSDDTEDNPLGTGVSVVTVDYIDANWNLIEGFSVIMNGTTPVNTGVQVRRIVSAICVQAGSTATYNEAQPQGNIQLYYGGAPAGQTLAYIPAGQGAATTAFYCIPSGKRAKLGLIGAQIEGGANEGNFFINYRLNNADNSVGPYFPIVKVPFVKELRGSYESNIHFATNVTLPERCDIWMTYEGTNSNNTTKTAKFLLVIIGI